MSSILVKMCLYLDGAPAHADVCVRSWFGDGDRLSRPLQAVVLRAALTVPEAHRALLEDIVAIMSVARVPLDEPFGVMEDSDCRAVCHEIATRPTKGSMPPRIAAHLIL
jgi:hypothetical protein